METDDLAREILWMYIPDFDNNGTMATIPKVYGRDGVSIFWEQDEACGGFTIDHDTCYLRVTEMELIAYAPIQCISGEVDQDCSDLVAYVRFNVRE